MLLFRYGLRTYLYSSISSRVMISGDLVDGLVVCMTYTLCSYIPDFIFFHSFGTSTLLTGHIEVTTLEIQTTQKRNLILQSTQHSILPGP